jgi:pilus assembly protein CpaF
MDVLEQKDKSIGITMNGWREKRFHISELFPVPINIEEKRISPVAVKNKNNNVEFQIVKREVREYFTNRFENSSNDTQIERWLDLQDQAIRGKVSAIEWFKNEIEEFLSKNDWLSVDFPFPQAYSDIVEAVYQETYGIGVVSTWWKHPEYGISQAASVIGTKVLFEIPGKEEDLQEDIYYHSEKDVERIAKQLSLRSPTGKLNPTNPSLEIDMEDGTRVTITIPPLSVEVMIIFRHFTIERASFEEISEKGTFERSFIPVLDMILFGRGTSCICGPVKSGKSTFLKACIERRRKRDRILVVHKDFDELRLHKHYAAHTFRQFIITDKNMNRVFPIILRSDYEYIVVAELRSIEGEIFLKSCSRGLPGALCTFHTFDPTEIPSQLADLILEDFANKKYDSQVVRAAQNIHFAFIFEELDNRSKRLSRLTVFDWNIETRSFQTNDILRWNDEEKKCEYDDFIPDRIIRMMKKYAEDETIRGMAVLRKLTEKNPIRKNVGTKTA